MTETCPKCHCPNCGLLESVIVGLRNWVIAIRDCEYAQRRKQSK